MTIPCHRAMARFGTLSHSAQGVSVARTAQLCCAGQTVPPCHVLKGGHGLMARLPMVR